MASLRTIAPRRIAVARALAAVLAAHQYAMAGDASDPFAPFVEESNPRGINYPVQPVPQSNGLYGFGVACIDLDDDGDDDLVATGRLNGVVGVFENSGAGVFVNRSSTTGLPALPQASAIAAADLDGDFLPELVLTQIGQPSRVFRNLGGFLFAAHAANASLAPSGATKAASLADIDGDGDLDLFLANYRQPSGPMSLVGNQLFRNDGTSFADIAPQFGIDRPARSFLGVFSDLDLDGDQDLYVSNDRGHLAPLFEPNALWRNDGGAFSDLSRASGAGVACYSMGLASGDFDGNGFSDFLVTNISTNEAPVFGVNPLLLGTGDCFFARGEEAWQVEDHRTGWGALFADLNDDGWLDLFVNHQNTTNALWINSGAPPAAEIAGAGGAIGVQSLYNYSTACADLDRDGDLELVENGLGANLRLYMNREGDELPSVRLRLRGAGVNASAIGARVVARVEGREIARELQAGGHGYLGQNSLELHFGLGGAKRLDGATVRFPDGVVREIGPTTPGAYSVVHPSQLGDSDRDGTLSSSDRTALGACIAAGGSSTHTCAWFDFDGDLAVDAHDAELFDAARLARRSDIDASGRVDAADLTALLLAWGSSGPADIDESGFADAADLTVLFAHWD